METRGLIAFLERAGQAPAPPQFVPPTGALAVVTIVVNGQIDTVSMHATGCVGFVDGYACSLLPDLRRVLPRNRSRSHGDDRNRTVITGSLGGTPGQYASQINATGAVRRVSGCGFGHDPGVTTKSPPTGYRGGARARAPANTRAYRVETGLESVRQKLSCRL